MKKIITLSIVSLVSGQIFAQTTAAKAQVESQKQKEMSTMSLKQAQDKTAPQTPAITTATPVVTAANANKAQVVLDTKTINAAAQATTTAPVAPEVRLQKANLAPGKVDEKIGVVPEIKADAKVKEEAAKATTPTKE